MTHSARFPLIFGWTASIAMFLGLAVWGTTARISGAVIAPGKVQLEQNRQVIEHPAGGVVAKILVRDGSSVEAGDLLVRLDGTPVLSDLSIVGRQLSEIDIRKARLRAERDGAVEMVFSDALSTLSKQFTDLNRQMRDEVSLFETRRSAQAEAALQHEEQIRQIGFRISGTQAQLSALQQQRDLIGAEIGNQRRLLESGLTRAGRVLALETDEARLAGDVGRLSAEIAELRGKIAAIRLSRLQMETALREEAVAALRNIEFREIELSERQLALENTLSRLDIRSPVAGIVYDTQVFAINSVVRPAEPMMYVIPQEQPFVIKARVATHQIDQVHVGQPAKLRFTAFNHRQAPEVPGRLVRLSADVLTDQITGEAFYSADIVPNEDALERLGEQKLIPGMPVQAFMTTGDRSPLSYLAEPLTDYFVLAFRD